MGERWKEEEVEWKVRMEDGEGGERLEKRRKRENNRKPNAPLDPGGPALCLSDSPSFRLLINKIIIVWNGCPGAASPCYSNRN